MLAGTVRAEALPARAPLALTLSAGEDEPRLGMDWYRDAALKPRLIVVVPGFAQHKGTHTMRFVAGLLTPTADVALLDLRGTGVSHGRFSFGQNEPKDVQAALAWAQAQRYADVALLGFSLGAYSALRAAVEGPLKPDACLLVSLPTRVEGIIGSGGVLTFLFKGMMHTDPLAIPQDADIFFRWGPLLGPKPVAPDLAPRLQAPAHLLVGALDELVYPAMSRESWERLPAPATFSQWPDGRHAEHMALRHPRAFAAWVAQALAWRGAKQEEPFTIALDGP
jgi:alpha-beta hydrolase superfamily lysophospholipase